ncbi:MAG: hypothetical protein II569_05805, partial [Paludibacteraceae bacterium]|nr:hypothetical protein [Paludibacteraceae bacterium]
MYQQFAQTTAYTSQDSRQTDTPPHNSETQAAGTKHGQTSFILYKRIKKRGVFNISTELHT